MPEVTDSRATGGCPPSPSRGGWEPAARASITRSDCACDCKRRAERRTPIIDSPRQGELSRAAPCYPPEDGAGHQPGAARIVEVEQPADQLARGKKPGDRQILDIEHMARRIDLHAAESKRDSAADRISFERRL